MDRGAFENSYWMADESRIPSEVEVLINGEPVDALHLENDWADARGMLSWHRQPNPRKLDEAPMASRSTLPCPVACCPQFSATAG